MPSKHKRNRNKPNSFVSMEDIYKRVRPELKKFINSMNYDITIDYMTYRDIVSDFNDAMLDELFLNGTVTSPCDVMAFEVRRNPIRSYLKSGKYINTNPVDWGATNKLWAEDKEAREKKITIQYDNKYMYKIKKVAPFLMINRSNRRFHEYNYQSSDIAKDRMKYYIDKCLIKSIENDNKQLYTH